jgi:uncharacterized Rmd1/YagE family protein
MMARFPVARASAHRVLGLTAKARSRSLGATVTRRTLEVEACSFESRFPLKEVPSWLPGNASFRVSKTMLVATLDDDQKLYAFDFGALVFVEVPKARVKELVEIFAKNLPREPQGGQRETFPIEIDPERKGTEVKFDRVIVPSLSELELDAVATVLAQSVNVDHYDVDLQRTLERIRAIADDVATHGRPSGRERDLVRFAGSTMASQVEIVSSMSLLEKPDFTWDDEGAERLYDLLRHHLEIPERFRALEAKLVTVRETVSQLLELITNRRMVALETAIVVLIVLEIVMALAGIMK